MITEFVPDGSGVILHNGKKYFSASYLAKCNIPKFPKSRAGVYKRAFSEKWESINIPGKGARDGVKYYLIPAFLQQQIIDNKKKEASAYPTTVNINHSITDMRVNDFVPMPKYSLQSMPDRAISSDQVVDYLAFKKDWLQYSMDVHDQALALIKMKGDSMSPTLKNNDLMLTDLTQLRLEDDSIYVLSIKNELVVKRVQRKLNGAFVITTDNSQNQNTHQEEIDEETAMDLPVIGKVIWYGRVI